jgi:hypothetical protein
MMRNTGALSLLLGGLLTACTVATSQQLPTASPSVPPSMTSPSTEPATIPRVTPLAESTEPKPPRISGGILPADLPPGEYLLVLETTGDPASYRSLELWASTGSRVASVLGGNISSAAISRGGALLAVRKYSPDEPLGSSATYLVFNTAEGVPPPSWGEVQGGATGIQMDWRPDGEGLAIPYKWDVYFLPLGSTSPTRLTDCEALLEGSDCGDPSWSPDGAELLFSVDVPGPDFEQEGVHILASRCFPDPSECTVAARGPLPGLKYFPRWSPSGNLIAGVSGSDRSLVVISYPQLELLGVVSTDGIGPSALAFSPDSRHIAFDTDCEVHILTIDTWQSTTFASDSDECRDPVVVGWIEVK